jgi:membrane associated rhomboid family serine protease
VLIRLVSLPAVLVLGLWFFLQLASALLVTASEPGVAFWAHVGGFVAGIFLLLLLRRRGTRLLQRRHSRAFYTSRARDARQRFGRHGDWTGPWG